LKIYQDIKDFQGVKNPIVTIGTFDGVHLGHQSIFSQMKKEAQRVNGETVVITFFPHPRLVLYQDSVNLKFINTREKKIERLQKSGVDHLIIIPFTKAFAQNSSEQFISDYVVKYVHPRMIIIGYDHHFGKDREGNIVLLERLKSRYGYEVQEVPPFYVDGSPVSSTRIRNLLHEGNVKEANRMLGYDYAITGEVVRGKALGRKIGYPTANIEIPDEYKLIAANGVYACRVLIGNQIYKGMGNIGVRPTIDHGDLTIEVNIFNFDQDIYGEKITIEFVDRLRDEKKFKDINALKKQLAKDKEMAANRL
jgi:riboflavin kinase/FMN adenylyltransferase